MKRTLSLAALLLCAAFAHPALAQDAPRATLQGRVADLTGRPIAGASVVLRLRADTSVIAGRAVTGPAGEYVITGVPGGSYRATASARGFKPEDEGAELVAGRTSALTFLLEPNEIRQGEGKGRLVGVVVNARTGLPVRGAIATLLVPATDGQPPRRVAVDTTGDRGRFEFEVAAGAYLLSVRAEGFAPATVPAPVIAGVEGALLFVRLLPLAPPPPAGTASLAGRVTDAATGTPLAGAVVSLLSQEMGGSDDHSGGDHSDDDSTGASHDGRSHTTVTGADGRYRLDSLHAGTYTLEAVRPRYERSRATITLATGERATRDIALRAEAAENELVLVSGRVFIDSTKAPVAGALVTLMERDDDGRARGTTVRTGADGAYTARVEHGRYLVAVRVGPEGAGDAGYTEYYDNARTAGTATPVEARRGVPVTGIDFGVPGAARPVVIKLSGRVTDGAGAPLAGAAVFVASRAARGAPAVARTAADGTYAVRLERRGPDAVVVWAVREGYATEYYREAPAVWAAQTLPLDPAAPALAGIDFTLERLVAGSASGEIEGTVTNANTGLPLAGAAVVAYHADRDALFHAATDSAGHYALGGLAAGSYYVLFHAEGFAPVYNGGAEAWLRAAPVVVNGTTQRLSAMLGGINRPRGEVNVSGFARGLDRRPVPGALVRVFAGAALVGFDFADAQGAYGIDGLESGRYIVQVDLVRRGVWQELATLDAATAPQALVNFSIDTGSGATAAQGTEIPSGVTLGAVYPNPFRDAATVRYTVGAAGRVTLRVYDALGRAVATLADEERAPGAYEVDINGANLPSGVYFCRLTASGTTQTRTVLLVR